MTNTCYATQGEAVLAAGDLADVNGSPVAVIYDALRRWYRLTEDAEEYDGLMTADGFEACAVLEPAKRS